MKEESKYYTPTIEEFRVGFEFEVQQQEEQYGECVYGNTYEPTEYELGDKIDLNHVRVKLLDREDIESLGFDNYIPPREYDHTWSFRGSKEPMIKVWFNNTIPTVRIYNSYPSISFQGKIKNKSELQQILKMVL